MVEGKLQHCYHGIKCYHDNRYHDNRCHDSCYHDNNYDHDNRYHENDPIPERGMAKSECLSNSAFFKN